MMNMKNILAGFAAAMLSVSALYADGDIREYREILRMQESGMHSRSRHVFTQKASLNQDSDIAGHAALSAVVMNVPGYQGTVMDYFTGNQDAHLSQQILYHHALNLFESGDYQQGEAFFSAVMPSVLERAQVDEYLFKRAYCELENGKADRALLRFIELEKRPVSDYSAPARYSIAYIKYENKGTQLHIQHTALRLLLVGNAACNVSLEPHCLA